MLLQVLLMGDFFFKKESKNDSGCYIMLTKDRKPICRTQCINPPGKMPAFWSISNILRYEKIEMPPGLPCCTLLPASENSQQEKEWGEFLGFLQKYNKVAVGKVEYYQFYIFPPKEENFKHVTVFYKEDKRRNNSGLARVLCDAKDLGVNVQPYDFLQFGMRLARSCMQNQLEPLPGGDATSSSCVAGERASPDCKLPDASGDEACNLKFKNNCKSEEAVGICGSVHSNSVQVHPSYLRTLGQAHSSWIFGALAEFIDNSRDAKATKLEISINMIYSNTAGKDIPMLSIIDDGHGLTHQEILRMISFGHKQPGTDDPDHIGRFGIGFKTGAMRLGKDALVLTQSANSRSIAFLSQSLNEGKDNLVIPIVSYRRTGKYMEIDSSIQDEGLAKENLKAIKEFSPFNKYLIGEKAGLFNEKGTGTQIYIWNLDEWGSNYSLQWEIGMPGGSSFHQGDILIRSRRVRSRPGQMAQMVPLDYSLRSYLEVIFFEPRMKIYVQGAPVKTRPLAKTLHNTVVKNGVILGKPVQFILGRCQLAWEQANCGIFLYWHGRLIEAYKRVGSMIHNGDNGRGIIGVIDLTDLMKDDKGLVWVHNNKQGFQDCEVYAELEKWLGARTDEYLDKYVNKLQLAKGAALLKPDHDWVQCDKCRKWRMLGDGFNSQILPADWFCYMKPFNGRCDMPEEKVEEGVVTISEKRYGYSNCSEDSTESGHRSSKDTKRRSKEISSQTADMDDQLVSYKKCRRSSRRTSKQ
ncbi:hypothetical protein M9H77_05132 [Catharanthus roseus]|uniref:Uncharacterized protein n=1 Tax=Catharanthus roseus TaxID=4058 RepID=A0ACC0CG92_CATRO|nr:hypothetical protein M9H77_05132 [Catharanthus roseus]